MSDHTSKPSKYPSAVLGSLVVGLLGIVSLIVLGLSGHESFSVTLSPTFIAMGSAVLILTSATFFLFLRLRATNRILAQQQDELQTVRDLAQDGRLTSLETTRTGSTASSNVSDGRLDDLESSQVGAKSGAAGMMTEIARLESRIASLEKPRPAAAPIVQIVYPKGISMVPVTRPSPFGDVHAVSDVEGIGPHYADLLNAAGIYNTRQLWEADAEQLAASLEVRVVTVDKWQQMAELIAIKGLGPHYAELLVRSGVKTIAQLGDSEEMDLVATVTKTQAGVGQRMQVNTVHASVGSWIRAARDHKAVPTSQNFRGSGAVR